MYEVVVGNMVVQQSAGALIAGVGEEVPLRWPVCLVPAIGQIVRVGPWCWKAW
jgi:hypothetical protein